MNHETKLLNDLSWWWMPGAADYRSLMGSSYKTIITFKTKQDEKIFSGTALIETEDNTIIASIQSEDGSIARHILLPSHCAQRISDLVSDYWFEDNGIYNQNNPEIAKLYKATSQLPEGNQVIFHGIMEEREVSGQVKYIAKLCIDTYMVETPDGNLYLLLGNRASEAEPKAFYARKNLCCN